MTIDIMIEKINARAKELMQINEVRNIFASKVKSNDLKHTQDWIYNQAIITLLYSHKERLKMAPAE